MKHLFTAFIIIASFSCNQNNSADASEISSADKLESYTSEGSTPRGLKVTITVTRDAIDLKIASHKKTVEKSYDFTPKEFDKLLASFRKLKIKDEKLDDDCAGNGYASLTFFKNDEQIAKAEDSECGEKSKNFSGAEIRLQYLIDDFDKQLEIVNKANDRKREEREDYGYEWTETDQKQYMKECVKMTEALMGKETNANDYCNCMMGKLQTVFPSKGEADNGSSKELTKWVDECSQTEVKKRDE